MLSSMAGSILLTSLGKMLKNRTERKMNVQPAIKIRPNVRITPPFSV